MQAKTQNVTFSPEGSFSATGDAAGIFTYFTLFSNAHAIRNLGNLEKLFRGWSNAPEIRLGLT
jgi:hypothetical protein